jgi:hypothetical protein
MPQHPEPHIRRAVRVLAMVSELHKIGYQRLRVMPFMSPSGAYWRCSIASTKLFYRNHGALLCTLVSSDGEVQGRATVASYSSGQASQYFGWSDAQKDDARSLAGRFLERFSELADSGRGWDHAYAGWFHRLLGLAEAGWLPVVLSDYSDISYDHIPLDDVRPKEWVSNDDVRANLPLPPPGELQQDHRD